MTLRASTPEQLQGGQEFLQELVRPPTAEVRNVASAADIDANSYFDYRGVYYKAPPLSHRVGIQLQEVLLEISRLGEYERQNEEMDEDVAIKHLEQLQRCYERAVTLFKIACKPVNPIRWLWRTVVRRKYNPFAEASGQEISDLIHFFSSCRTKSRVRQAGSLAHRQSLSLSMQRTTLPTS
jgi:hypothetical protein